jgi:proteasome accessory factor C
VTILAYVAKDTEKLIRQLSLISYLMAERRPVTAMEIRRDVEGYSAMNEDAFARRFYADRSELEALGIHLTIERPADGQVEQENYSLPPENFYLPPVEFTDAELAALQTALSLLDGEFAYAEPLRLALQQLSWGRPRPDKKPGQASLALGITATAGGHDLSQRLAKIETAIFRRKTVTFDYYTIERDKRGSRTVDPYLLLFQAGQYYLVGRAHDRDAIRVFRLSRISGKVSYATKAEHDFQRPEDFDPRAYARRAVWQFGESQGPARIELNERISWQVERHFGDAGELTPAADGTSVFTTDHAQPRAVVSWVLGLGTNAKILEPKALGSEYAKRLALIKELHTGEPQLAKTKRGSAKRVEAAQEAVVEEERDQNAIRPERFARLVTLASILIEAGRTRTELSANELMERLQVSDEELREDIGVLNIVNFGAGSYVLYAEVDGDKIEVDPEPYGDSFARPARLLPVEAKALVAAIDLLGEHVPEASLASAREKVVAALGSDPVEDGLHVAGVGAADDSGIARTVSEAVADRRILELEYYKQNEDELVSRKVEPYALMNGREGWYVAAWDPDRDGLRHFRLDRIKSAVATKKTFEPRPEVDPSADVEGWPRTGEVPASQTALVWISPERARWAREERTITSELSDGSVVVEVAYAGTDWLVKEILKEAGDAAVIEPPEARKAVLTAVSELGPSRRRAAATSKAKGAEAKPQAKKSAAKKPASASKTKAKPRSKAGAGR